jgi:hypothetical protein
LVGALCHRRNDSSFGASCNLRGLPSIRVEVTTAKGALSGDARNEWDISLNDELPTDLVVQLGAGESNLDLDSLALTGLDLQMGAGKTTVDLTGDYAQNFEASIRGGLGEATTPTANRTSTSA